MRTLPIASAFAALMTVASCGTTGGSAGGPAPAVAQPVTAEDAAELAKANAASLADGMATKTSFLTKSDALDGGDAPACDPPQPGGTGEPTPPGCVEKNEFNAQKAADEFKDWLGKNILNKQFAAPSLSTATEAVFCLSPEVVCKTTDESGKDAIDAKCAKGLADVPVCVSLSKTGPKSMTGKILVGKAPALIPATFALDPDNFSGKVDLAVLREAAIAGMTASGEKLPEDFPQVAAGVASVKLERKADLSFDATFNIDTAVHVGAFTKSNKRFYDIKLAQTAAAVLLHIGQKDKAIFGSLGLNGIEVGVAMDLVFGQSADCSVPAVPPGGDPSIPPPDGECPPPTDYKGAFFLKLAGIGVNADYAMSADDKVETVQLSGITLGPDTAHLQFDDGAAISEIASLDLNKTATPPRKVDVVVTIADHKFQVAVAKLLEVVAVHELELLGKQLKDLPKALFHGTSQLRLDGAALPKVAFIENKATPEVDSGGSKPGEPPPPDPVTPQVPAAFLHVLDGKLLLQATGLAGMADIKVEVPAGQCLVEKAKQEGTKEGEEPHPFSMLQAGACP